MNGTAITFQWCIEVVDRQQSIQNEIYESQLANFEDRLKLLKKGNLCLVRTESEGAEVRDILWAYREGMSLDTHFENALGKRTDIEVPERFIVELQRFMNKDRRHTVKKKETNLPQQFTGRKVNFRNDRQPKEIKIKEMDDEQIPIRVDKKTIVYVNKNLSLAEVDKIISKYKRT